MINSGRRLLQPSQVSQAATQRVRVFAVRIAWLRHGLLPIHRFARFWFI